MAVDIIYDYVEYALTNEQTKIVEAVKSGEKLIKINAFAGTGKTSTLIEISKLFSSNQKILYIAFNKSIQEEASKKFPKNVTVKTTHSLAYGYLWSFMQKATIKSSYKPSEIADMFHITYPEASIVLSIFKNYCNSASQTISIDSKENSQKNINMYKSLALKLFEKMTNNEIDITYDFFLKLYQLQLLQGKRVGYYDLILLDEAQDTNDVTLSIFYLLSAKQKVVVGDKHQQIYSFRGGINAMQKVKASLYHLTNSFRFNQKIAKKATDFLSLFKKEDKILKGIANNKEANQLTINYKDEVYISRSNAKLIEITNSLIEEGKYFKTIREPYSIFGLSLNILKLKENEEIDKSYSYLNSFLHSYKEDDNGCENIIKYLLKVAEEIGDVELSMASKIASKYGKSLFTLYRTVNQYYKKTEKATIFLTTAHTSKGLEWDCINICNDFNIIRKIAQYFIDKREADIEDFLTVFADDLKANKVAQEIIDELNLYYVAITRAKKYVIDDTELNILDKKNINFQIKELILESDKEKEK